MRIVVLVFLSLTVFGCAGLGPQINQEYDEFRDTSSLTLNKVLVQAKGGGLDFSSFSFHVQGRGKTIEHPENILIQFVDGSNDRRFYDCRTTTFLIDGERIELSTPEHDISTHEYVVYEHLFFIEPYTFFEKLANAKDVRLQVCNTEFEFGPAGKKKMKEFYDFIEANLK